jgi:hypothetical protein
MKKLITMDMNFEEAAERAELIFSDNFENKELVNIYRLASSDEDSLAIAAQIVSGRLNISFEDAKILTQCNKSSLLIFLKNRYYSNSTKSKIIQAVKNYTK